MAVPSPVRSITYNHKAAATKYAIPFSFSATSEVDVTHDGDVLVEGTDYEIDGETVVMLDDELDDDVPLVISRTVPFKQLVDYSAATTYSPATHMGSYNALTYQTQQLADRIAALEEDADDEAVVAGDGLFFSGDNLHVGSGPGARVGTKITLWYGAAADIKNVNATAFDAGVADLVASGDHKHNIDTAAPVAGAVVAGGTASAGVATTLAHSDHVHAVEAGTPVNVNALAADEGVATTFARSDHKHDVDTDTPGPLTDSTNAEGSATTLVLSDHTHAHGERAGGTLHAVAITGATAGFLAGSDKAKLDGLDDVYNAGTNSGYPSGHTVVVSEVRNYLLVTTALTKILEWTITDNATEMVRMTVAAYCEPNNEGAGYIRDFTIKRDAGTASLVSSVTSTFTEESDSGWDVSVALGSGNTKLEVSVDGPTEQTHWTVRCERLISYV